MTDLGTDVEFYVRIKTRKCRMSLNYLLINAKNNYWCLMCAKYYFYFADDLLQTREQILINSGDYNIDLP